jgi:glutathione synthase/RimK-type ligase-like ATP-grasp enzyme
MILLWGVPEDAPLRAVRHALAAMGSRVALLDQFEAPATDFRIESGVEPTGWIRTATEAIDIDDIRAAYLRPYDSRRVLALLGSDSESHAHVARLDDALLLWAELTRVDVVNPPAAMATNGSKPLQALLARGFGFEVPATLLTNDAAAARAFEAAHGTAIYKSISGVRSRVTKLHPGMLARLEHAAAPVQLQAWVDGTDWRVHVVGEDVFACTIESDADDYRYAFEGEAPRIAPATLPADITERCLRLARGLRFHVTGIDLRRMHDGRWMFFEANPSPGFTFYEEATGAPIAASVAALLSRACRPG